MPDQQNEDESRPIRPNAKVRWTRSRLNRLVCLARYYRPSQFAYRLLAKLKRRRLIRTKGSRYAAAPKVTPKFIPASYLTIQTSSTDCATGAAGGTPDGSITSDLEIGRIRLLNQEAVLGKPLDWRCSNVDVSHLWRFNLHYHEFLLDIVSPISALNPQSENLEKLTDVWQTILHWIKANPLANPNVHDDAWHPFCISRRLLVWFRMLSTVSPPDDVSDSILKSAWQQTRFLNDHLEKDLGGNHLLENLRTLAISATVLDCDESVRWRKTVKRYLPTQLDEQILASGEHFERAPHYHVEMLDVVCDLTDCLASWQDPMVKRCGECRDRMSKFLKQICHPDGDVPLFADGRLEGPAIIHRLLLRAGESLEANSNEQANVVGDYWTYQNKHDFLIFDAGPMGADHLPAHAHSDLLNFEASISGSRFIVDTGTFQYEEGEIRNRIRSTQAHNCLEIDGFNQCDVWSRFRVGHRGKVFGFDSGRSDGFYWSTAFHNAYRDLGIPRSHRLIVCHTLGWWIFDWCHGKGNHRFANHLHFFGKAESRSNKRVLIDHQDRKIQLTAFHNVADLNVDNDLRADDLRADKIDLVDGDQYPEFGVKSKVLWATNTINTVLPTCIGWQLNFTDAPCNTKVNLDLNGDLIVVIEIDSAQFRWNSRCS